jgi:chemotaxis protein methyltransferase CheR
VDAGQKKYSELEPEGPEIELELLLEAIFKKYQYEFRDYSRASLRRRLSQALLRFDLKTVSQLQERVLHEREFFPFLLNYLTVPTTELFRDPLYFQLLRTEIFPMLRTFPSLKIWIAGCSTGEEVFSLAILLREEGLLKKAIFYATDINPHSLEKARRGIFELEAVQKGSLNYRKMGGKGTLSDYYKAAYGAAQFDPSLIENTAFSDHSLATDSVFAEVQLVSCRNVLIYFNRDLQNRAFSLFKDSLARGGYLGLGSKETIQFSAYKNSFTRVVPDEQIYRKN